GWRRADRIGRRPHAPATALPARIHAEICVARDRPVQQFMRKTAPTTIAKILNNKGNFIFPLFWKIKPSLDIMPTEAGESHVEHFNQLEAGFRRNHAHLTADRSRFGNGIGPERSEVGRHFDRAAVGTECGMNEIGEWHVTLS